VARRFVGSRAPVKGPKRLMQWIGPAEQGFLSVANGGTTLIQSFAPLEPLTVIRNRGILGIIPETFTADIEIVGAFGIIVVSTEAFAAGVASMPSPFSDANGDWMVWQSFAYRFEFADGTGINFPNWTVEVDSKAMRKMGPNKVMVEIAESQEGTFQLAAPVRTLVKF